MHAGCGGKGLWFAQVSPDTGKIIPKADTAGVHRGQIATRDLRKWLKRVGLTYHSPHKFRHGHAVYALKMAKDVSALKAVSQNLMHANLSITDGVYGVLSEVDIKEQIGELGRTANSETPALLISLLEQLLGILKSNTEMN